MEDRGTRPVGGAGPSEPKGLLARVLAVTSDAVAIVSLDGRRLLYVNDALCERLGSSREQLLETSAASGAVAELLVSPASEAELRGAGSVSGVPVIVPGAEGRNVALELFSQIVEVDGEEAALVVGRARQTPPGPPPEPARGRDDAILRAAASAAASFLRSHHWSDAMEEALGGLAEAAGTQRAFLFENERREDGSLWMIQRCEWCAPGVPGTGPIGKPYPYGALFSRWEEVLGSDGVVRGPVSSLPEPEQGPLLRDEVRSMVAVPVSVSGEWWGFVGFDDCETEDAGSPSEVDALRVAANALGAAIEQRSLRGRLREVEVTYEHLLERLPGVVYIESLEDGSPDIYLSPQYVDLYGADPETRLNRPNAWREMVHPDDLDHVLIESARSTATSDPFSTEYRVCRPDGTIRWVRDECVLIRTDDGRPLFWLGLVTDLTQQREAEDRSLRAEERYRVLVEHLPAAAYVESLDGGPGEFYISPQIERMTGWPAGSFEDDEFWASHVHPDDQERVMAEVRRTDASGEPFSMDYRFLRADGSVIWLHEESQPVTGKQGQRLNQGVISDVTEQRLAQEQVAAAEARYRSLLENLPIAIYQETVRPGEYPGTSALTYLSPQFGRQFGFEATEVESWSFWEDVVHPEDRERVMAEALDAVASLEASTAEYRVVTKAGETLWVQDGSVLTGVEEDGTQVWLGVITDISERKEAEARSSRAGDILRAVAAAAERFLSASDWRDEIDQTLRELGEATGMSRAYMFEIRNDEEGVQRGWETYEWCAPGVASTIDSPENQAFPLDDEDITWRRKLEAGQTAYGVASDYAEDDQEYFEREGIKSVLAVPVLVDGTWWGHFGFDDCFEERSWTEGEIESLRAAGGMLSAAIERQLVGERLGESEATHQSLVERLPGAVYMADMEDETGLFYVSPQYESMFGYSPAERIEEKGLWKRLVHPDDLDRVLARSHESHVKQEPFSEEYRIYSRDGRMMWIRDEAVLVRDTEGGPRYWLGLILDVTERRAAEDALRRHDAILGAVGFAAQRFLDATFWEDEIGEVLRRLGEAGAASRSYLFRNEVGPDGRTRASIVHEWCAAGVGSVFDHPDNHAIIVVSPNSGEVTEWARTLDAGGVVRVDSVGSLEDEAERRILLSMNIRSLLEVPIFAGGEWWGWLGFDQCAEERVWSQAEADALQAGAGLLGAVVQRLDAESQLRRSEERQRLLVERMPAVVYIDALDSTSTALYISPQVESMLGFSAEERLATPSLWVDSLHPDDREWVQAESDRTNETHEPFMLDYRMVARDGSIKWVRDEAVVVYDDEGKPLYWQGVLIDITERKRAEEELERALHLERQAVERLRTLDDMKNTFLTAVSHDLRTPLAAVLGLALTLEREDIQLDAQVIRDLAHRIAVNSRKLDRLVTDLLDLDRLSRGILEPKVSRTDLGLLARKAVEESEFLSDHSVTVDADSVEVRVDTPKIERIIENLLANTVRHTPPGTNVIIRVRREGSGALLTVEDDGPGVPPDLREAIFEPFRQGGEKLSHSPGVGIGLSLVARFAELHGGRAWVAERDGGGASFRVFLPEAPPGEQDEDARTVGT